VSSRTGLKSLSASHPHQKPLRLLATAMLGSEHPQTLKSLHTLINLDEAWGKSNSAYFHNVLNPPRIDHFLAFAVHVHPRYNASAVPNAVF